MRNLFTLFLLLSLSACGYSPKVVENAYNNLGNQYGTQLKQLTTLTEEQKAGVDAFADGLQRWHRQHRLPEYAELVGDLGDKLRRGDPIGDEDLLNLVHTIALWPNFQDATDSNRQLAELAKTLSDEQLAQVAKEVDEERREQQERLLAMADEALVRARVRYVNSMAEFLGVVLSKEQLDLLRIRSASFHDQRETLIAASRKWSEELIQLLRNRHQPGFKQRFVSHMASDNPRLLLLQAAPDTTRDNDRLSVQMLQDLLASLSREQRDRLTANLLSMSDTLNGLAEAEKSGE